MLFSAPLPEPREYGWKLKSVGSAKTTLRRDAFGGVDVTIQHEVIRGITVDMLAWWFQHLDRSVDFRGDEVDAYLLWHPYDHVSIEASRNAAGQIAPGETIHLDECFARNPAYRVVQTPGLHRWDAHGIGLHVDPAPGLRAFSLDHEWKNVDGGVRYSTRMHMGVEGILGSLFNAIMMPSNDYVTAWMRHNVEEVGNFENFLPELAAKA